MLRLAEEKFGERDRSYTILGIEYSEDIPRTWYPGNCKHIAIQLGPNARSDMNQALFHLAHETIHLLAPTGSGGANILEEGLATHFSSWYLLHHCKVLITASLTSYVKASAKVDALLAREPGVIRRLRTIEPSFRAMTSDFLKSNISWISAEDADYLTGEFRREA
jgi:hypothetical protein